MLESAGCWAYRCVYQQAWQRNLKPQQLDLYAKRSVFNSEKQDHAVLVRTSTVKGHPDRGNSCKRKCLIGAGLQFQRFSPLSSWQKTVVHADLVMEKELRALCLDPQAAGRDYATLGIA